MRNEPTAYELRPILKSQYSVEGGEESSTQTLPRHYSSKHALSVCALCQHVLSVRAFSGPRFWIVEVWDVLLDTPHTVGIV